MAASTNVTMTDLEPGSRVRCYDALDATMISVVATQWPYVVVRYDHDEGTVAVYPPYIQPL